MGNKLTNDEISEIQKLFSDFIKMDGPRQPFPILAKGLFKVFNDHFETIEDEIPLLQELDYSSNVFGAFNPFLIDVTALEPEEIEAKRKVNGQQRYLSGPLTLREHSYLVCKEFYLDKGGYKKKLYSWFCDLFEIDTKAELLEFTKDLDVIKGEKTSLGKTPSIDESLSEGKSADVSVGIGKYEKEIKRLEYILNGTMSILARAEVKAIKDLIDAYRNESKLNEELIKKVNIIIERLRKCKDVLSSMDI